MKKLILTLTTLAGTFFCYGAEEEIDITPVNFRFPASLQIEKLIPNDIDAATAANLAGGESKPNYIKNNFFGENPYEDGIIVLGGLFCHEKPEHKKSLIDGISVYNFGGTIGNALVINGYNSGLASYLGESNDVLPSMSGEQNDVIQLFWLINDNELSKYDKSENGRTVKIRFEINAFSNPEKSEINPEKSEIIVSELSVKNDNNTFVSAPQTDNDSRRLANIQFGDFVSNGEWNLKEWMSYEMEASTYKHPLWVKMQLPKSALNNGALLIRKLDVTFLDREASYNINKTRNTYMTEDELYPSAQPIDPAVFTDYTPAYFKFYNHHIVPLQNIVRDDLVSPQQFHLGNDSFISGNTEKGKHYFSKESIANGQVMFGGYYGLEQNSRTPMKNAMSMLNLGGEIGNVLVINGCNSKLNEKIYSIFGEKLGLTSVPEIPRLANSLSANNLHFYWLFDHVAMSNNLEEGSNVRIRMELNGYHEDMSSDKHVFTSLLETDELKESPTVEEARSVTYSQFSDADGNWNPNKWMVYEFEVPHTKAASYLKMILSLSKHGLDDGAILIRSIEIYGANAEEPSEVISTLAADNEDVIPAGAVRKTWNTYAVDAEDYVAPANDIRFIVSNYNNVTASVSPSTANPGVDWEVPEKYKDVIEIERTDNPNTVVVKACEGVSSNANITAEIRATSVASPSITKVQTILIAGGTVGVDEIGESSKVVSVKQNGNAIAIEGVTPGTHVSVYTIGGLLVAEEIATGDALNIPVGSPDCYVVKIGETAVKQLVK